MARRGGGEPNECQCSLGIHEAALQIQDDLYVRRAHGFLTRRGLMAVIPPHPPARCHFYSCMGVPMDGSQ
jgi:hypothetical protein